MIYGVFGGEYSGWYHVGYFDNRLDADKYCALYNNEKTYEEYYVIELENLKDERDLSKVSLKYAYEILFDFKDNNWIMRDEPDRYKCYIADDLKPNSIDTNSGYCRWVRFTVNINKEDRKFAEKIAQDYLYELLAYGESKVINDKNIKLMNDKFLEPFRIKEKLRKQEALKQKELAELARLKEKYES